MTQTKKEKPANKASYGSWSSKITSDLIVTDSISIDEARQIADSLYYIERRPQEGGRCVIVKSHEGITADILPAPYSARSRVHEYGGGCYCVQDDTIFFVNDSDQDIYLIENQKIKRITTADNRRFADFAYDRRNRRLLAVSETHENETITNSIVSIDISTGVVTELESTNDFYASPRLNNAASQICWQTWRHPNMPWDGNQLWIADITKDGQLSNKRHVAGGDDISVFQPQWSKQDILHFISDETGWWHMYRCSKSESFDEIQQLTHGEKEFGLPQWVFAQSTYAFINDTDIICCYQSDGRSALAILTASGKTQLNDLACDWQEFNSITADAGNISFIAASSDTFPQLVSVTLDQTASAISSTDIIKSTCQLPLSNKYYSRAEAISFINRHQQTVYANYYPPYNPDYQADEEELPPLITICHGGPTGQSSMALDARKQFWTSRGFALLDVNYSGSTGYGRRYRSRLDGKWGVLDVEDCCDAALHAVTNSLADKDKLIIRGSSAGGFTVLAALTFEDVFSAGASYYGISDLTSLTDATHKFESHYNDRLV
ncbi:MAG: prolyl oligopeptidase family serine peptidase, partial [Gammaproteobacteria bacterium]|nr:prolyl oligopeptidase family serine peptidase [Gammaproteobacteria bacterium]